MNDDLAISVRGLRRTYGAGRGAFEAVRGIDLAVARGTITALLGTNGAGKTSTLEVVEGLARATAGEVRVLGLDPVRDRAAVRRRTGILLQDSGFAGDLTVAETLRMWASTLSHPRPVAESVEMLALGDLAGTRVRALSGGERRRLDLACAFMGHPELLLLDEPTTGLDPESRREVWQLIRGLRESGSTVLFSTHYLEEAETLADRLAIMHAGRIVTDGTAAEITSGHPSTISFDDVTTPLPELRGARLTQEDGVSTVHTDDLQPTLTRLLSWAEQHQVSLPRLSARTASLESVFLAIADRDRSSDVEDDPPPSSQHDHERSLR